MDNNYKYTTITNHKATWPKKISKLMLKTNSFGIIPGSRGISNCLEYIVKGFKYETNIIELIGWSWRYDEDFVDDNK